MKEDWILLPAQGATTRYRSLLEHVLLDAPHFTVNAPRNKRCGPRSRAAVWPEIVHGVEMRAIVTDVIAPAISRTVKDHCKTAQLIPWGVYVLSAGARLPATRNIIPDNTLVVLLNLSEQPVKVLHGTRQAALIEPGYVAIGFPGEKWKFSDMLAESDGLLVRATVSINHAAWDALEMLQDPEALGSAKGAPPNPDTGSPVAMYEVAPARMQWGLIAEWSAEVGCPESMQPIKTKTRTHRVLPAYPTTLRFIEPYSDLQLQLFLCGSTWFDPQANGITAA